MHLMGILTGKVASTGRARDGASRHRRRALVIGVVLASVPVVVATAPATVSASSIAVFDYSMPSRYGMDSNGDGVIDSYVPTATCTGETASTCTNHPATSAFPVKPAIWRVNLDACASGAQFYLWSVLAEPAVQVREPRSGGDCDDFYAEFPEEGTYRVGLRTKDELLSPFGPTTWMDVVVQDWLVISMGDSYGSGEGAPDVPIDPNSLGDVAEAFDGLGAAVAKLADFGPCAGTAFNFDDCVIALNAAGNDAIDKNAALIRRLNDPVCDILKPFDGFDLIACGELLVSLAITVVTDIGAAVSSAYNNYVSRFQDVYDAAQDVVNSFETLIENFERGAAWQDRRCHRSANAGAALAAKELEEIDPRTSVTLIHVACTGGMILQGVLDTYVGADDERESRALPPLPPQVHQAAQLIGDREIDIVHFSVGGNDVNFAPMIFSCVLRVDCSQANPDDDPVVAARVAADTVCPNTSIPGVSLALMPIYSTLCREFFKSLERDPLMGKDAVELFRLGVVGDPADPLRPGIANAYGQLNDALFRAPFAGPGTPDAPIETGLGLPAGHNDRVYITEYVNPLLRENGGVCSQDVDGLRMIPGVSLVETTYLNSVTVGALTEVVRSNAAAHGWNFIGGIAAGFESASGQGHGYCAEPDGGNVTTDYGAPATQGRWMVRLQDAFLIQGNKMGGVHPNRSGYRHYANQILPAWLGDLYANPTTLSGPRTPGAPVADAGPDRTLNEGEVVALANNSSDDGPLQFAWSSSNTLVAAVNPSDIAQPNLTAIDNGSAVVGLDVVDTDGGTATDNATITVLNMAPTVANSAVELDEGSLYTGTLSFTDPGTLDTHSATIDYGDGSTENLGSVTGGVVPLSHRYVDNGTYTISVTVTDDDLGAGTGVVSVTVLNVAPTVANSAVELDEGSLYTGTLSFTDPGTLDTHSATIDYGDGSTENLGSVTGGVVPLSHRYVDNGTYTISVTVTDDDLGVGTGVVSVAVLNVAPMVTVTSSADEIFEGSSYTGTLSFTDPGTLDTHTATIDYGDGTPREGPNTVTVTDVVQLSHLYVDDESVTVSVTVTDKDGGTDTGTASVTVRNVAPVVGAVTAPVVPVLIGTGVNVSASFTDVGIRDLHTATINWGDGVATTGTVAQGAGSGSVSGSKSYSSPGIYTVTVHVSDDDGGTGSAQFLYVVVYDPAGGFVTGGGLIDSQAGAYVPDPSVAGRAQFAFISKYQKGASIPQGTTSFRFNAANFVFASTSYEWLVVSGAKATYKGRGTVNGLGDYGFLLSTVDGDSQSVPGPDRLRLKVWNRLSGDVIYDNQLGAADDAPAATTIAAGAITVSAPKRR